MNLKPLYSLFETIPYLHYIKKGIYNKSIGTIILLGGAGYNCKYFNKVVFDETNKWYNKFYHERKYPNINFQNELSKYTETFSFDRPIDMLQNNLYNNENYKHFYIASLSDLTIQKYANFMYELFKYHKLKPPYIFYGISQGAYDALIFSKFYPNLIKRVICSDSPLLEKYMLKFEYYRGNKEIIHKIINKDFCWKPTKKLNLTKEELINIDDYNSQISYYNHIFKLKNTDFNNNVRFIICYSPFKFSHKPDKEYIKIVNKQRLKLQKYTNVSTIFINGPHQLERTLPLTMTNLIINSF